MPDAANEPNETPNVRTIRQLVKLMHRFDLTALDWENETSSIKLRRGGRASAAAGVAPPAPVTAPPPLAATPTPPAEAAPVAEGIFIRSPMVGTFYESPSPEAKPYVTVGSPVRADTHVCLIEAMKVFTEINAGVSGTIVEVLAKTGQAVEFDQPLFRVQPA